MEKWSFQRTRELMTPRALRGMAVNEVGRARISMMVRSMGSNSRPDTLVQDRTPQPHRFLLQRTAGPYMGSPGRHDGPGSLQAWPTCIGTGRPSLGLERALLHVRRLKNGSPATHPLTGKELRALRRLQREQELKSPFVFTSERGTPFTKRGFQAMVERAGKAAGFDMKIHPHMLRHACGFKLANDGVDTRTIQAYLGHKSIQHTVRYTELAPTRFKRLFRD